MRWLLWLLGLFAAAVAVMLVAPELFNAPVPASTASAAVMSMVWN